MKTEMQAVTEGKDSGSHCKEKMKAAIGGRDVGGHWGQRFRQMWRTELQAPREGESSLGTGSALW